MRQTLKLIQPFWRYGEQPLFEGGKCTLLELNETWWKYTPPNYNSTTPGESSKWSTFVGKIEEELLGCSVTRKVSQMRNLLNGKWLALFKTKSKMLRPVKSNPPFGSYGERPPFGGGKWTLLDLDEIWQKCSQSKYNSSTPGEVLKFSIFPAKSTKKVVWSVIFFESLTNRW